MYLIAKVIPINANMDKIRVVMLYASIDIINSAY